MQPDPPGCPSRHTHPQPFFSPTDSQLGAFPLTLQPSLPAPCRRSGRALTRLTSPAGSVRATENSGSSAPLLPPRPCSVHAAGMEQALTDHTANLHLGKAARVDAAGGRHAASRHTTGSSASPSQHPQIAARASSVAAAHTPITAATALTPPAGAPGHRKTRLPASQICVSAGSDLCTAPEPRSRRVNLHRGGSTPRRC